MFGHGFDGLGGFRVIKSLYFERGIIFHKKLLVFSLLLDLLKTRGWEKLLVVLLGLDRNSIVLVESQLFRSQNNIPLYIDLPGGGALLYVGFIYVLRQVTGDKIKFISIVHQQFRSLCVFSKR